MKNNLLFFVSLFCGILIVLILTNSISIGKIINKYFPCQQNIMNSFPCYGKYDLTVISISLAIILAILGYVIF